MKLEFVKVLRDCQHNKETAGRKIYDHDVIIDGVKRATWSLWIAGQRGYVLLDLDDEEIRAPFIRTDGQRGIDRYRVRVDTQAEFGPRVLAELEYIPTPEQIEQRRKDRAAEAERKAAEEAEAARVQRIKDAGPELLKVLVRIVAAHESGNNGTVRGEAVLCEYFYRQAKAAIKDATEG